MSKKVVEKLKQKMSEKGFKIFKRPFELNMVAFRNPNARGSYFDDELHVFYLNQEGILIYHLFNVVTDPGSYWKNKKGMPKDTPMLAEGQYYNAFSIGKHKGIKGAIVQSRAVDVYPTYDRKGIFDLFKSKKVRGKFSISILPAKSNGKHLFLSKDMEGCQVIQRKEDFELLHKLALQHSKLYGNALTYTLIDERIKRRNIYRSLGMAGVLMAFIKLIFFKSKKDTI